MDKKIILIVIIAGILALISAFAILGFPQKSEVVQPAQPIIEEQEKEINPIQEEPAPVKISEPVSKPVVSDPVKKVSYKKPQVQKPEAPVQKVEAPVIKPLFVEEVKTISNEPIPHENVFQEENSNDIVITKEYKTPTQARYSFK